MNQGANQSTNDYRDDGSHAFRPSLYAPESRESDAVVNAPPSNIHIAHQAPEMAELIEQATQFADNSATLLVTGESGTGKELICRLVHSLSGRPSQRFVAVNCAAIPEMLVESEFFGHSRGAFTGAFQQRVGHFERADGGTILLDEISEISPAIQSKLLRVLEEGEIQRIGSNECRKIDVRVIATSNRDLRDEVNNGRFRLDLYHRLNILSLRVPSLRQRPADIPCLAHFFIEHFNKETQKNITGITQQAMQALLSHSWPGNVRELRNVIHRACILCRDQLISTKNLGDFAESTDSNSSDLRGMKLSEVERILILESLRKFGGNKQAVADELGITTRTLNNKLKKYRESEAEDDGDLKIHRPEAA